MATCVKCQKSTLKGTLFCPYCIETTSVPKVGTPYKSYCSNCGLNKRMPGRSRCSICNIASCRVCGLRGQYQGICPTCAAIEELEPNLQQYLDRLARNGYTGIKGDKP